MKRRLTNQKDGAKIGDRKEESADSSFLLEDFSKRKKNTLFIENRRERIRVSKIDGKTRLVGLFGYPVEHSFSPLMHNGAFHHLGLNYAYLPFPVAPENLKEAVAGVKALGLLGVNVTIPHKERVMEYLDQISPAAKLIGAVNTIVCRNGELTGYNTDGPGFIKSLEMEAKTKVAGKSIVVIGAGGAARAVAIQSALEDAQKIILVNRDPAKAQGIKKSLKESGKNCVVEIYELDDPSWKKGLEQTDILVDTSPVGMYPHIDVAPVVEPEFLTPNLLVCDLVYNPLETVLLKTAKERGAKTWGGLGMLIYQGALAFELWTGEKAPVEIMEKAVMDYLGL